MARIAGERRVRTVGLASTWRPPLEWIPLAIALTGVGLILGPGYDLPAWAPFAGAITLGAGAYWLGLRHGQAAPDPAARGRVTQLERALLQFSLLLGNDGLAGRADRGGAEPQREQPGRAPSERDTAGRTDHHGPTLEGARGLDDPLPGET